MGFFSELFKPAWQSKNAQKARKAVEKMTNQVELARVIRESSYNFLRNLQSKI